LPEIVSVLPKYLQIANHIREQILRGDLEPGSEVPSERQIADDWNVARPTATKALQALRQQGLVETKTGQGTFVRDAQAHRRASYRYHRYRERGAQYAPDESVEITDTGVIDAPDYVADALRLDQPTQAMMRRRVISREGHGPVEIATSWWSPDLAPVAPRLLVRESLGGIGSVRYVAEVTGRHATYARDQASGRLATDDEARALRLNSPAAVLVIRHTVFDREDRPMEFAEAIYPPDVWNVEQEYPIES
jgi:GntR family transcriptional regulator